MRCFYSSSLGLDLPADHPFPGHKSEVSKQMLIDGGIVRGEEIVEIRAASTGTLKRVHDEIYLSKIYHGQLDLKERLQLGLPITRELYTRSATEVEATRLACLAALEDGVAAALAGGTHQAYRQHGETYCVFNDIAAAIKDLQVRKPGIKIMVIDTAASQGSGTNSLVDHDPNVFTYSIHVGLGPQKKIAGSMDVETVRFVEGQMYLKQLFNSLAAALEIFSPDLVIWVSGADTHRNDRFGLMQLELGDLQRRDEVLLSALLRNRIPVAILYGGGFNRNPEHTAEIHRNTIATAKKLQRTFLGTS